MKLGSVITLHEISFCTMLESYESNLIPCILNYLSIHVIAYRVHWNSEQTERLTMHTTYR